MRWTEYYVKSVSFQKIRSWHVIVLSLNGLEWHPEFEGIISGESWEDYQTRKNNKEFTFNDLLYDVELPSEVKPMPKYTYRDDVIHKDDSNRMFPNFNKKKEIHELYGGLLVAYLAYLV